MPDDLWRDTYDAWLTTPPDDEWEDRPEEPAEPDGPALCDDTYDAPLSDDTEPPF